VTAEGELVDEDELLPAESPVDAVEVSLVLEVSVDVLEVSLDVVDVSLEAFDGELVVDVAWETIAACCPDEAVVEPIEPS
jgi:hypothetical protein